ncbi:MAG: polysaccharide biosynthesis C-terminal domain-containing protein [Enterococcus sp.]
MKLVKNYLYNASYQLFILIIPLITIPYVSRVLGSQGIGINAYTNSIVQYFILFGSIGINLYGNRSIAYHRDDKQKLSQTFWEITILRGVCIGISCLGFFIFVAMISQRYQSEFLLQSFLILAAAFDISWLYMGMEDFKKTVVRNTLVKLISLACIFLFVHESGDIGRYIAILSVSTLLGNLTFWSYLRKIVARPDWQRLNITQHILPSLSLFLPQVATQVYLVLNKSMLGVMIGVMSAGYFENSDRIVRVILAVVTATGTVMLPRIANTFAKGDIQKVNQYLYSSLEFVSCLAFPLAFGVAAVAPKFSVWFMGEDFAITGQLIPILCPIIIFIAWSNVFGTQYLLPTGRTKLFTLSVTVGAVVNIVLNILLIPLIGVFGAVIATVVSEFAVTLVQLICVKEFLSMQSIFYQKWKYLLAAIIMYVIVANLHQQMNGSLISFLVQAIVGITSYALIGLVMRFPIVAFISSFMAKRRLSN